MPKFMTIHNESNLDRVTLESRWTEISMDLRADWKMTLYNLERGIRFCEWNAPNTESIEEIFRDLGIAWSEILEVEATQSSEWRPWAISSR